MEFRTIVDIEKPGFEIQPCEELLLVGSCFACPALSVSDGWNWRRTETVYTGGS